jgi:hypothetical protein
MSALRVDSLPRLTSAHQESNHDLLRRLVGDVLLLLNHEVALATAEMKQHIEVLVRTMILFLAGSFCAMTGLLLLANAAALMVGRAINSTVGGYIIVGAAIALIGTVVVAMAKSRLARQSLTPTQTLDEIRRDVTWMSNAGKKQSA